MSCEFYFKKWKQTLAKLEELARLDLEYQITKAHDKNQCEAVARLTGMLGKYVQLHNDALECLQVNLQVQKTRYIKDIVKSIINRILELKHSIRKLECSNIQFMGHGLTDHKLTPYDAEMTEVLPSERSDRVKEIVKEAFRRAEEKKQELLRLAEEEQKMNEPVVEEGSHWWDEDEKEESDHEYEEELFVQKESEETLLRRQLVSMIQAHERSRQLIQRLTHVRQKREMWKKELMGILKPKAPREIQERSAQLIQKVFRAYFEIKRRKRLQCREEEYLGLRLCERVQVPSDVSAKVDQLKLKRIEQRKLFEQEWANSCEKLKEDFMKRNVDIFAEDYRDFVRSWFKRWFDDIKFFYDIPKDSEGGSFPIMIDELPEPLEWWEEYQTYLETKKSNKNQSSMEKKFAEMRAMEEEMMKKKEELMKKKLQADLKRKLMKNPTQHPGFDYPHSVKTESILEVIQVYRRDWNNLDGLDTSDVNAGFVRDIDISNVYAEVKKEIMNTINDDMRKELKLLKKALKKDYANNEMEMPEPMKKKRGRKGNKKKKLKCTTSEDVADKMQDLAFRGILQKFPPTKLSGFSGDHNYAGDDIRCNFGPALPFNGELRSVWWERCLEVAKVSQRVLIVGPRLSGKTLLVHALATVNEAVLFTLDPTELQDTSDAELQQIASSVVACARAVQPSVVYIRHVHKLYFKNKVPLSERINNPNVLKRILLRKLCKKIQKTDKITIIASCVDPWQTKSFQLLQQFHKNVVLIPNTSYSTVVRLLKEWINNNHSVPRDLDVSGLARVLQGYTYGYLLENLNKFLSAERIVKIAAYGLFPQEIYDYILDNDDSGAKIDYEKYSKWYSDQTQWGKKEKKHTAEQREFKQAIQMFEEKKKKKKKIASAVSSATNLHSPTEHTGQ